MLKEKINQMNLDGLHPKLGGGGTSLKLDFIIWEINYHPMKFYHLDE